MLQKNQVPDGQITDKVNQLIGNRGMRSPCKVTVVTLKGQVTLSGTVVHAHQKVSAVQAARGAAGVKRVVDNLVVKPQVKY